MSHVIVALLYSKNSGKFNQRGMFIVHIYRIWLLLHGSGYLRAANSTFSQTQFASFKSAHSRLAKSTHKNSIHPGEDLVISVNRGIPPEPP